jgi:hypothetical protein
MARTARGPQGRPFSASVYQFQKVGWAAFALLLGAGVNAARAQTPPADTSTTTATTTGATAPTGNLPGATGWWSNVKVSAQVEAGIAGNPAGPDDGENFGQLFTDHANQVQLNQVLLTAQRPIDSSSSGYDWGFKLQGMYGSDARYTHFMGELDRAIPTRYQIDIVEANVAVHLPWLFQGGIDAKVGQYATPLGYETIDPTGNPFYSHSYIFNFGLPFKHTGVLTVSHVTPMVDFYLGIDSGTNTSLGAGDNNDEPAGIIGFGLNLLSGNLTVLALSHMGPENPTISTPFGNSAMRYYNDIYVTYKATPKLSFTTEVNYVKDDGFRAEGYGAAQYVSYALNDKLTLNGRAEVWRDNSNFFVAAFPGNQSYIDTERGFPTTIIAAPCATTYSEFTVGITYKPNLPAPISGLMLRPEIRYDRALNGVHAFNAGQDAGAVTLAADAVLSF